MDIVKIISEELNLKENQISNCITLLDQGDTVPFISRYRKDVTGNMIDVQVRYVADRVEVLRQLEQRKQHVFKVIDEQGKMTEQIAHDLENATTLNEVEDIYRPYKVKKETRVAKALKANLDKLADYIQEGKTENPLMEEAAKYVCDDYKTPEACIQGASDIIAGKISDNPNYRNFIKKYYAKSAVLKATKSPKAISNVYDNYANFENLLFKTPSFRILAINRGVKQKCLTKEIILNDEAIIDRICDFEVKEHHPYKEILDNCVIDAYNRLIKPSISNEFFSECLEKSEDKSIEGFKLHLRQVLLEAPVKDKVIMGIDPGLRTGCKIAIIDAQGTVIYHGVAYLHNAGTKRKEHLDNFINIIKQYKVNLMALGNGTGGRETEEILVKYILPEVENVSYCFVSESGASIYSASDVAREEFPEYDVTIRGAISIARRLLDPLSELVKIPPESIGVGQYQHDLNQTKLKNALKGEVEDVVNLVGVDLNIASSYILTYISGLSKSLAKNIVEYKAEHGAFKTRSELLNVKGFGNKAFENCAGFLRIDGEEPLDNTAIHPESYKVAKEILKIYNIEVLDDFGRAKLGMIKEDDYEKLAKRLHVGVITLQDIVKELIKPTRDPRTEIKKATLLRTVNDISKVKVGMVLEGTVRNITEFGAFVDIGVHNEGLLHKSEISENYVSDINQYLKIGDIIKVKVILVDLDRKQIKLSMKKVSSLPLTTEDQAKEMNTPKSTKKVEQVDLSEPAKEE